MSVADVLENGQANIDVFNLAVAGTATFVNAPVFPPSTANIAVYNSDPEISIGNSSLINSNPAALIFNNATQGPTQTSTILQSTNGNLSINNNDSNAIITINTTGPLSNILLNSGQYVEITAPGGVLYEASLSAGGGEFVASGREISTQTGSATDNVNCNSTSGLIHLFPSTLAALSSSDFFIYNSNVILGSSPSVPLLTIAGYTGTTGIPAVIVYVINAGNLGVSLYNTHPTAALNGTVTLAMYVV